MNGGPAGGALAPNPHAVRDEFIVFRMFSAVRVTSRIKSARRRGCRQFSGKESLASKLIIEEHSKTLGSNHAVDDLVERVHGMIRMAVRPLILFVFGLTRA